MNRLACLTCECGGDLIRTSGNALTCERCGDSTPEPIYDDVPEPDDTEDNEP